LQIVEIEFFGAPITSYALHKTWGRRRMARLLSAARANFGPPGIFKWEGLFLSFWCAQSLVSFCAQLKTSIL